ncbi:MAG: DUF4440 domain-containing protein [Bacteroidales bacterium]|nr:DUF4440 domain-containing protein [Bacteroidales bacterium]
MKKYFWTIPVVLILAVTSCQVNYNKEADKQALSKLTVEDWDSNINVGKSEANVEFYTEDAIRIDFGKVYSGKDEIHNLFNSLTVQYTLLKLENKVEDTRISGDLATVRGSCNVSFIQKESNDTINAKQAWVDICERQTDGSWKMILTIVSELKD